MAEAIVNTQLANDWEAHSAGTKPSGYVHPKALQVLAELGIKHQGRSKDVTELRQMPFDLVVTVCDAAAEECPVWFGPGRRAHLGFPDPAQATGSEEEVLEVFRQVRDDIAREIPNLLKRMAANDREISSRH
jgi:arsenate reductase (thioredoxin)